MHYQHQRPTTCTSENLAQTQHANTVLGDCKNGRPDRYSVDILFSNSSFHVFYTTTAHTVHESITRLCCTVQRAGQSFSMQNGESRNYESVTKSTPSCCGFMTCASMACRASMTFGIQYTQKSRSRNSIRRRYELVTLATKSRCISFDLGHLRRGAGQTILLQCVVCTGSPHRKPMLQLFSPRDNSRKLGTVHVHPTLSHDARRMPSPKHLGLKTEPSQAKRFTFSSRTVRQTPQGSMPQTQPVSRSTLGPTSRQCYGQRKHRARAYYHG